MMLSEGRELAEHIINKLVPVTDRCMVCGSIRRKSHEVSDVDLVVIPRRDVSKDMFGNVTGTMVIPEFITTVNQWPKLKGEPYGRYTQRLVKGHKVEISIAQKDNFGNLVLIRTGNADFSHMIMNRILKMGLQHKDGHLYDGDKMIPIPEEDALFRVLNLPYIEPVNRNKDAFRGLPPR